MTPFEKGLVFLAEPIFLRSLEKVISCMESVLLEGAESSRIKFGVEVGNCGELIWGERLKIN